MDCECRPEPAAIAAYNDLVGRMWDEIRWFLGVHFKFNTRLDTPFWRACRADVDIGPAQQIVDYYVENGPSTWGRGALLHPGNMFGMEGYLAMLIGMQVPHRRPYVPSAGECQTWYGVIAQNRQRAETALTVEETLRAVTSAAWSWVPGYFVYDGPPTYNR